MAHEKDTKGGCKLCRNKKIEIKEEEKQKFIQILRTPEIADMIIEIIVAAYEKESQKMGQILSNSIAVVQK